MRDHGCDIMAVHVGHRGSKPPSGYGTNLPAYYSDKVRNLAGVRTIATVHASSTNYANTLLAQGQADLILMMAGTTPKHQYGRRVRS